MQADIHPEYKIVDVICGCGNAFQTRSAVRSEVIRLEVCSECHPFYTGKHKVVDTAGRIEQFMRLYGTYKREEGAGG